MKKKRLSDASGTGLHLNASFERLFTSADLAKASGLQTGDFAIKAVLPSRQDHSREAPAYVGLEIARETELWPSVVNVHDLLDSNGVLQGHPGYLNHSVKPGDVIIAIDGQSTENVAVINRLHACR